MADCYAVWDGKVWVGRCLEYSSVTYLADSAPKAIAGIEALVRHIDDTPPAEQVEQVEPVEMHLTPERGLEFAMRHPIVPLLAEHLASAFKDAGGINYVTFEIDCKDIGPLSLIMQRRWGETPERQAARYRGVLEQIASCESHATGDVVDLARKALEAA